MTPDLEALLDARVRSIPDWPVPGVIFRDITPLLADPGGIPAVVDAMTAIVHDAGLYPIDVVAGIEARGFILGAPLAVALGVGFVPVRKQGKLPGDVHAQTYDLEYGTATLEVAAGAVSGGHRVLIVDDVLATGGTAAASISLLRRAGANVVGFAALIELPELGGRAVAGDVPVLTLRSY